MLFIWWALVYVLKVPPFVAPSPVTVAQTLVAKFDILMVNLWPTALQAVLGFLLGNLAAIIIATRLRSPEVDGAGRSFRWWS